MSEVKENTELCEKFCLPAGLLLWYGENQKAMMTYTSLKTFGSLIV